VAAISGLSPAGGKSFARHVRRRSAPYTYEKLIDFKREILELCHKLAGQAEPQVARAIEDTDVILLEVQVSRFQQKRDCWRIRATEIAGSGQRGAAS
jgi:hypothetical protein